MNQSISIRAIFSSCCRVLATFGIAFLGWWLAWLCLPLALALVMGIMVATLVLLGGPVSTLVLLLVAILLLVPSFLYVGSLIGVLIPFFAHEQIYDHPERPLNLAKMRRRINFWLVMRTIGCGLAYLLCVIAGLVLLIVPGLIMAVRLHYAFYFVVLDNDSIPTALQKSWQITKGNFWRLTFILMISKYTGPLAYLIGMATFRHLQAAAIPTSSPEKDQFYSN